jgi:hypothetical protein
MKLGMILMNPKARRYLHPIVRIWFGPYEAAVEFVEARNKEIESCHLESQNSMISHV